MLPLPGGDPGMAENTRDPPDRPGIVTAGARYYDCDVTSSIIDGIEVVIREYGAARSKGSR